MKKIISLLLVVLVATAGAFAYVEQTWGVDDVEDVLFDGSHIVFDARWGNTSIGATYAKENFSVYGALEGFKMNLGGAEADNALRMGGTIGGSFRSENFRIGLLANFAGNTTGAASSQNLNFGLALSFLKDKIRIAVPVFLKMDGGVKLSAIAPAYVKFKVGAGSLDFLRVRFHLNDDLAATSTKTMKFDLDANFYNDLAERFGAETLVRASFSTLMEKPAGTQDVQNIQIYVEPYIFGYNEGNVIQIGLVPFITAQATLAKETTFGFGDTGIELRTEFQPVKNFRARLSVQTVNNGDWGVKWNIRTAWYY